MLTEVELGNEILVSLVSGLDVVEGVLMLGVVAVRGLKVTVKGGAADGVVVSGVMLVDAAGGVIS